MPAPASRVLFLGLDGGTSRVFEPAFDRGWMPHLEALWRRSARGVLRSSDPMVTPVAWTSFLTGCTPPRHGIHEFYRVDPDTRIIHPNDADRIRVPTLWQTLSGLGREVVSLNLPMTYPATPEVRGLVVAGTDAPDPDWAFAHCPDFGRELRAEVPAYPHKILWKSRPKRLDDLNRLAARTCEAFAALAEAAIRADARSDWTALLVHFHDLDSLQHRLWPYLDVDDTGIADPAWNGPVIACLRALDDAIGRLVELASSRDAAVVALSDHGFGPCRELVDVNGLLCRAGLQRRLSYGTRFRYRFHRLADRLGRWKARRSRYGHSRRTPRSIEGSVGCDWSRTVAFAPFGQLSGCIFLNRDLVRTQAQADAVAHDVLGLFAEARHPDTGELLFADVFRVADRYGLDPQREGLPDVLALSADGFQAQAKWSPFSRRWIEPDPGLPGTHHRDGILSIFAPDVRPGDHLAANLHDVAPTSLAMLGLPAPTSMEGRILTEAFESHPLGPVIPAPSRAPRRVATAP
jgi:predicted AlkP superfamily phosphohydrolase/phosphomutase